MRTNRLYRTLAVAVISTLAAVGCQSEHKKFASKQTLDWEKARLGIMYEVANQQYKVGDFDKCKEGLSKMLLANVQFAPMHVLAAKVALEGSNSLEDAAEQLKKAIEINPADAEPYYLLGVVYQRWQKFDTAAEYYQQACEKKPTEANYVLAVAEMKISEGKLDEAKDLLEAKAQYFEQSAAIQIGLAKIATLQGDPAAAAQHLRGATLLVPEDKNVRWSYAQALFDAGKFSDAAKILEAMRNDPPTMPAARDELSKAGDPKVDEEAAKATKVSLLSLLGQSYRSPSRKTSYRCLPAHRPLSPYLPRA
jgi:Flp pilus assembly protein TadD